MARGRKKGMPKIGGKVLGSKHKTVLPDVAALLADKGINPVEKLIELVPKLQPHQAASVWQTLLEYTAPKPKLDDKRDEPETVNPADELPNDILTQSLRAAYANNRANATTQ